MIDDLDQVLRQLLIRELPIKNREVDVDFDQPTREWSGRLSRPTLNLFLYDLRENNKLRQTRPAWARSLRDMLPYEGARRVCQHLAFLVKQY